jgi:hypoxanthine phosphoribosyltransferase
MIQSLCISTSLIKEQKIAHDFHKTEKINCNISWEENDVIAEKLARQIIESGWEFSQIICINPEGSLTGILLSNLLSKPVSTIYTKSFKDEQGIKDLFISKTSMAFVNENEECVFGDNVLIVDASVNKGVSLEKVKKHILTQHPTIKNIRTATQWANKFSTYKTDYFAETLDDKTKIVLPFVKDQLDKNQFEVEDEQEVLDGQELVSGGIGKKKLFYSWDVNEKIIRKLAKDILKSGWEFDQILCVPRGGALGGALLAYFLGKPLAAIHASSYRGKGGMQQKELIIAEHIAMTTSKLGKRLLLVDDLVDSGLSVQKIVKQIFANHAEVEEIRVGVQWFKKCSEYAPYYFAQKSDEKTWIVLPFEKEPLTA